MDNPTRRTQLGKTQFRVPETPEGTGKEAQEGREDEEEAREERRTRPRKRPRQRRKAWSPFDVRRPALSFGARWLIRLTHRRGGSWLPTFSRSTRSIWNWPEIAGGHPQARPPRSLRHQLVVRAAPEHRSGQPRVPRAGGGSAQGHLRFGRHADPRPRPRPHWVEEKRRRRTSPPTTRRCGSSICSRCRSSRSTS